MYKHFVSLLVASLGCTGAATSLHQRTPDCLTSSEAADIAKRWVDLWETDSEGKRKGPDVIQKTVTPDFVLYDEGTVLGNPDPEAAFLYKNRKAMEDDFSAQAKWGAEANERYTVLLSFSGCDTVGVRWQMHAKSRAHPNATAPIGSPVIYKGIDILEVDLKSRLTRKAISSADYLNYYLALGLDVMAPALSAARRHEAG